MTGPFLERGHGRVGVVIPVDAAEAKTEAEAAAVEGVPGVFAAGDEVQVLRPDPPVVASR